MFWDSNIITNGSAASLAGWTTSGVTISSLNNIFAGNYFLLQSTASMRQHINLMRADINLAERAYRFQAGYFLGTGFDTTSMENRAYVQLEFNYFDGSIDTFVFPLVEGYTPHVSGPNRWHHLTGWAYAKENAILNSVTAYIITNNVGVQVGITSMTLQRSISDLEEHNDNLNPHNLPLAIQVGQFGIRATKGTEVQFWLKDTGDAFFKGRIEATDGYFSGELRATSGFFSGELRAATGTFSGALQAASGTFAGALQAATGTFAGDLSAAGGTFRGNLQAAGGTFAGSLQAASGTFTGSLTAATGTFAGSLQAASGTFTGNLVAAGGTFNGTLQAQALQSISINANQITAGQIQASQIATNQLVVGTNIQMGPNATLTWGQVSDRPTTAADPRLGGVIPSSPLFTHITQFGIYTGTLNANQINAGLINADRIDVDRLAVSRIVPRAAGFNSTSYLEFLAGATASFVAFGTQFLTIFGTQGNAQFAPGGGNVRLGLTSTGGYLNGRFTANSNGGNGVAADIFTWNDFPGQFDNRMNTSGIRGTKNTSNQPNHNHGITPGTRLAVVNASNQITGFVTWAESGGHSHTVTI